MRLGRKRTYVPNESMHPATRNVLGHTILDEKRSAVMVSSATRIQTPLGIILQRVQYRYSDQDPLTDTTIMLHAPEEDAMFMTTESFFHAALAELGLPWVAPIEEEA